MTPVLVVVSTIDLFTRTSRSLGFKLWCGLSQTEVVVTKLMWMSTLNTGVCLVHRVVSTPSVSTSSPLSCYQVRVNMTPETLAVQPLKAPRILILF